MKIEEKELLQMDLEHVRAAPEGISFGVSIHWFSLNFGLFLNNKKRATISVLFFLEILL